MDDLGLRQVKRATYPAYKPSGVEWLGDLPKHWEVRRLKYAASINDEALPGTTDPDYEFNYVDIGNVDAINGIVAREPYRFEDAPSRARRIVHHGDTIVSTVRTYLRAIASIREPDGHLIVSTGFAVVRPRGIDPQYLSYSLRSPYFVETIVSRSTGVSYPAINASEVSTIAVTVPSAEEQGTIASFLDRETGRIDALIAKKQRQIELLQEKRAALTSHAVTKGLDPNVKMKDSGIEWLGQIPEHWEVWLLKRVCCISYGMGGELDRTLSQGVPILSLPNVTINGTLSLDEVPLAELPEDMKPLLLLRRGDLLFNWRNGSADHLGKTAYFALDGEYTHVSFLLRLRFDPNRHDSRYYYRLLNGFRATGFFASSKAGVNNTFNQSELNNLWVIVPPHKEQVEIADFLGREAIRIDRLVLKIEQSVVALREYRTALISAAVMGKIDVRERLKG